MEPIKGCVNCGVFKAVYMAWLNGGNTFVAECIHPLVGENLRENILLKTLKDCPLRKLNVKEIDIGIKVKVELDENLFE